MKGRASALLWNGVVTWGRHGRVAGRTSGGAAETRVLAAQVGAVD